MIFDSHSTSSYSYLVYYLKTKYIYVPNGFFFVLKFISFENHHVTQLLKLLSSIM